MGNLKEHRMLFQLNAELSGGFNSTFSKAQKELANMQKEIQTLSKTQSDINAYQRQQSAIEETREKLELYRKEHEIYQQRIKKSGEDSTEYEIKLVRKQAQIDKTAASLKYQTEKLDKMGDSLKKAGIDTDNLTKESEDLSAKMGELKSKQAEAAESARGFGSKTAEAFSLARSALVSAGLVAAYREIFEAAAECAKASIEFESAITGVYKTVDGTSGQLETISQGIKEMAVEMPASTTEIAAVAEAAGQLGIATEDVLDFTKVMIDLGESTNLTADEAATSFAKFANITGTSSDNYSRLGSSLVALGNNLATTEADIVAMSTRLASAGSIAGFTEPQIMALSAAMSSVGIEAEAGGTAMTQTLNSIETAVAKQSGALSEFARISGMTSAEFSAAWKSSPIEALQSFIAGLGSLDENGESTVLVLDKLGLTGIRQSNMLKSLGLAAETMSGAINIANTAWEENTALTNEANKRYATTESQLKMMRNNFNNLKISVGDAAVPALKVFADVGNDIISGTTSFVQQNPAVVQGIGTFVGAMGTVTAAVAGFNTVAKIASALNLAAVFTNPVMIGVAGAAAVGAIGVGMVSAYNEAQEAARNYGDEVTNAVEQYKQAVDTSNQLDTHIAEWEQLNSIIAEGTAPVEEVNAAKDKLKENEQWLIDNYGIYLDGKPGVSQEEIDTLSKRNEQLRETARLQAQIALNEAVERYREAEDKVGDTQEREAELSKELSELANERVILGNYLAEWKLLQQSDVYQTASTAEQTAMYTEAIAALHKELEDSGITNLDFSGAGFAGVETELMSLDAEITKNQEKLTEYREILLEYNQSALEYKQATENMADLEIANIKEGDLASLKKAAQTISQSAQAADLEAEVVQNYANQLTEVAHSMGLIPEEQSISFGSDTSGLDKGIKAANEAIDSLPNNKTVTINALVKTINDKLAEGGYASGTDYAIPGAHWVGENGPELLWFNGGERVMSARESAEYARSYGNLFASNAEPLSAKAVPVGNQYKINIAPQFIVEGGNLDGLEDRLDEFSNIVVGQVMDVLEEKGIDARRSAYV